MVEIEEETREYKQADERLRNAYEQIDSTNLEPEVKVAVKAVIAIRQIVDWKKAIKNGVGYQVDPALVKYIRTSSAPDLPKLVHDVITKLPFDLAFKSALGEYIFSIYPQSSTSTNWQRAHSRLKKETIPLVLLSKKFYQDTEEETIE